MKQLHDPAPALCMLFSGQLGHHILNLIRTFRKIVPIHALGQRYGFPLPRNQRLGSKMEKIAFVIGSLQPVAAQ
jgi:hypothetical protein